MYHTGVLLFVCTNETCRLRARFRRARQKVRLLALFLNAPEGWSGAAHLRLPDQGIKHLAQ